ncbi:MAG TPA: hypothetical protein VHB25_12810 [Gemmatimonadaceae bacterium]|nr:hypothetical protein [Gemmatimonadaceae bacterium]
MQNAAVPVSIPPVGRCAQFRYLSDNPFTVDNIESLEDSMAPNAPMRQDANDVVDDFAAQLGAVVADEDAQLARVHEGNSDRSFVIAQHEKQVRFVAKISQSGTGFWGLGIDKASEMITGHGEHLVLLTAADEGYFVSATRLKFIAPQLSSSRGDYKIGESKVRKEPRFRSLEDLWEMLRGRLQGLPT